MSIFTNSNSSNLYKNVRDNDRKILELANYYESKGNTIQIKHPNIAWNRFTEFKMRIKRGCITIDQLEQFVLGKYGIVNSPTCKHQEELSKEARELLNDFITDNSNSKWEE